MAGSTRREFLMAALTGFGAIQGRPAFAHGGHLEQPPLTVLGARRSSDGAQMELDLELFNSFGVAATLRGLSVSIAERVEISRRRTLFGSEVWQPAPLLRLEPGETIVLARPDYSVSVHGVAAGLEEPLVFEVVADFGPLGEALVFTVASSSPPVGPMLDPAPAETDQTIE